LREHVDGLAGDFAVGGHVLDAVAILEEPSQCTGVDDCAGEQVRTGLLPLLDDRDRDIAQLLGDVGMLLEQLAEPHRARETSRPGADDQHADLDALIGGIRRLGGVVARAERRRIVRRADGHVPRFCFTSSVSFGTISCTSPTTPRSENSKIGAFGSLLIATITFELCMPTLCSIAPEMPSATDSLGETTCPVGRICAEYGYQPASTTARVAPTAPPSAFASSSASAKFSGAPRPRPPATITSASSIEGPLACSASCATTFAARECSAK